MSSGKSGISTTEELHTLQYTYNRFNKVTSFTDSLGKTEYYEYSPIGLLLKYTARNGAVTEYVYDAMNRIICKKATLAEENDESPVKVETVYARNGLKIKETVTEKRTSGLGVLVDFSKLVWKRLAVSYVYDNKGRLIKEISPDNTVKEYSYDLVGNRSEFKLFKDSAVDLEIHLCYTYVALYILETLYMNAIGTEDDLEAFADYSVLFDKVENITSKDIDAICNSMYEN